MSKPLRVDAHAHFFPAGISLPAGCSDDPRWPRLAIDGDGRGRIMRGDNLFRPVHSGLWDVADRLAELDDAGVDHQVVSPVPVTLVDWAEPASAAEFARRQNDALAEAVSQSGGRLHGLCSVPMQDPDAASVELRRAVTELGLVGVEIGTRVNTLELDDESLTPFFRCASELDVPIFVHPVEGGGGSVRRTGQPYDFGLGMTTDTALAASALVFGGVLERLPGLRFVLSHGGGSFPAVFPRMRYGAQLIAKMDVTGIEERVRSLYVDSIVHDPDLLTVALGRFGTDRVVLGSDCPFFPDGLARAVEAIASADVDNDVRTAVLGTNACSLFTLDSVLTNR